MKIFVPTFLFVILVGINLSGQTESSSTESGDQETFCKNDPRTSVRIFCKDLTALQMAVNNNPDATTASLRSQLNKLDLANPAAAVKFVTTASILLKPAADEALQELNHLRPDQQLTAPANANGTTSLVSKAGSAALLAFALDSGVLTRSINGTTTTLSTNADQVFRLITGRDPDCTVTCISSTWFENKVLNPLSVYATLDVAQRSTKTIPTTGSANGMPAAMVNSATIPSGVGKLSGITARYEMLNHFDPRSDKFKSAWADAINQNSDLGSAVDSIVTSTAPIVTLLRNNAAPLGREKILQEAHSDHSGKKLANFFANYFADAAAKPLQDADIRNSLAEVVKARALYRQAWLQALKQAAGNLFTFEYNYNRPASQPITHDFKLIYAYSFKTTGMVTFNGTISLYDSIPTGAKYGRTHYGQVSAQYDRVLSGKEANLQTQLSFAGYWQYQPEPSILNIPAGTVVPGTNIPLPNGTQEFVGTAGSLWVTQAKFTIKGSGGVNIPVAVSWSNKTDLLQGSRVGAQVGINYNFSSFAGLFTGSGTAP